VTELEKAWAEYKRALETAKSKYNILPGLSASKLAVIAQDPKDAAEMLRLAEQLRGQWERPGTKAVEVIRKVLDSVKEYGPAIDAVMRLTPLPVTPIVWGSIKLALQVCCLC
jgi:hypothetical protein